MLPKRAVLPLALVVALGNLAPSCQAAVIVLANRTDNEVRFTLSSGNSNPRSYTIAKGDVLAVPAMRAPEIAFTVGPRRHRVRVTANEIYFFIGKASTIQLKQIALRGQEKQPPKAPVKNTEEPDDQSAEKSPQLLLKIPVRILVDQSEPNVQNVWEKRLRQRVKNASDILERYCRVQLEVIDAGTWHSDEGLVELADLLRDFQSKAALGKGRLAIGFTGLRGVKNEDRALGCTIGPLHTHILIGEYRLRTEPERLEVLLHELGHFLGACHSPESDSVLRPRLGDGRANLRAFRMGFDAVNTLAMNLVAEELARRPVRSVAAMPARTRRRLLRIYNTLAQVMPQDPAALYYHRLVGPPPPDPATVHSLSPAVLDGARAVLTAITNEAKKNQARSSRDGDELTAHYFRVAAAKCRQLPAEQAALAYTLGLAVALDRASLLRSLEIHGISWSKLESEAERRQRLEVLGEPTIQGRASMTQSFVVSAALALLLEGQPVAAAGLQEELLLLQGGDHFRFDTLVASMAGTLFATQLDAAPELLDELAKSFRVSDYVPVPKGLPAPLDRDVFSRRFGSMTDERFLAPQDALRQRLLTLPGYQPRSK